MQAARAMRPLSFWDEFWEEIETSIYVTDMIWKCARYMKKMHCRGHDLLS